MMSHAAPLLRVVLLTTATLAAAPALADTLTQAQIATEIIGKDLVGRRTGMTVRLRYDPGGKVTMKAAFVTGAGTWKFAGDSLCMTMTKGPKRGETCLTFEKFGDGSFRNSEGMILRVGR